jgi:hypothetical protein
MTAETAPILIHIGYHKTATKWLRDAVFPEGSAGFRWLPKWPGHPVSRLVRDRPLDFDAAALRREFEPLLEAAAAADEVPVITWGRLAGQAFSGGYDRKEIADRLKAVFPEARILIVIREQRSVILSTYKQYVKAGGVCTLEQFLYPPSRHDGCVPGFDFAYFEYDRLISYYRQLYDSDAVLVLPYEQLVRDPRDFVAAVLRFAGRRLPDEAVGRLLEYKWSKKARSALTLGASRPLNRFGPVSELNPAPLLESGRVSALANRLRERKVQPANESWAIRQLAVRQEASLRRKIWNAVGDRYLTSNRATAEMIGVDLASYGWML